MNISKTLILAAILALSATAASPSTAPKPVVKHQADVIYPVAFWVFLLKGCGNLDLTIAQNYALWLYQGKPVCEGV